MSQEQEILDGIIIAYRQMIHDRYQYDYIKSNYDIPDTFTQEKLELLRTYFLDHIYPTPDKRKTLNEAFDSLNDYVRKPDRILKVMMDAGGLIFKFGFMLPKILNSGIKALQSFNTASKLESNLVKSAIQLEINPPYNSDNITTILTSLDKKDIEEFIEDTLALFEILHDRKLVSKVITIVNKLVNKMKQKPDLYSAKEIKGLELGREIITEGDLLYKKLNKQEQDSLFGLVAEIERETIGRLYG